MSAATIATIGALIEAHPPLAVILDEHIVDNDGEVLPHLVMADVMRLLVQNHKKHPAMCRSVLDWLEREYTRGPEDVQGLIALSGVEMIPDPGEHGAELREMLGPELHKVDPWINH